MVNSIKTNSFSLNKEAGNGKWFFFALLFIIIDYGRPQDIIPIGFMRPGMIVALILIYYIITTKGVYKLTASNQTRMIWYFILLTAIYIPFAVNNFWAYTTTKMMLMNMPFILSIIVCVNSVQRLKKLMIVMVLLLMYVSLYGIAHAGVGSGNYFADENDLSLFINMLLPFCYFLFLYEKGIYNKMFYAVAMIIGLAGVVVSFSRGGLVGLLCVGFVIWLGSSKKIRSILLLVLIGIVVFLYSGDEYIAEMKTITNASDGTANERMLSWKAGWDMFLDNPLGVGGNNFQVRFAEYQSDEFSRGMWGRVAHSLWFTLIPELGIVGIFIYFSLLRYNIRDILFVKRINCGADRDLLYLQSVSAAMLASLAGYFASGTFLSVLYYPHYWYMTAIIVAMTKISINLIEAQD